MTCRALLLYCYTLSLILIFFHLFPNGCGSARRRFVGKQCLPIVVRLATESQLKNVQLLG